MLAAENTLRLKTILNCQITEYYWKLTISVAEYGLPIRSSASIHIAVPMPDRDARINSTRPRHDGDQGRPEHRFAMMRDRRGVAAAEFGMIAVAFLTLLLFVVEVGYDLSLQITLDHTLRTAARQIQTGAAATMSSASTFQSNVLCPAAAGLLTCSSIAINVTAITADYYSQGSVTPPITNGQLDTSSYGYCEGQPRQLMLLTALYTSPSLIGNLVPGMTTATAQGLQHVTMSSTAFVNESWPVTYAPANSC